MIPLQKAIRFILLSAFLACAAFARDEYTRVFDKTLPLASGGTVSIEHRLGDIVIRTHPERTVVIHAEIHTSGPDRNEAEQFANQVEILGEDGGGVSIRTHYPGGLNNFSYYVRYELTIPEDAPLEVRSSFGSVSITGLKANAEIRTSHGAIAFRDGKGEQHFDNSFGAVEVSGNLGEVTVNNTNGQIKVIGLRFSTIKNAFGAVVGEECARNGYGREQERQREREWRAGGGGGYELRSGCFECDLRAGSGG